MVKKSVYLNHLQNESDVNALRRMYVGRKVKLIKTDMNDLQMVAHLNQVMLVNYVDDAGTLHGKWLSENTDSLGICLDVDEIVLAD